MARNIKSKYIDEERILVNGIPTIFFAPKENKKTRPTIILYHGWGSNKESQRIRAFILSALGYQVFVPDAVYHGERSPIKDYGMDKAKKYFWDTIFNNIDESSRFIGCLISDYGADPEKIGLMGNSMGGFTAGGVFGHNPNIKALLVLNGSCNWGHSNQIFKNSLDMEYTTREKTIEEKIAQIDPMNRLDILKDRPILILHGDADNVVDIESQRIFYEKIKPMYRYKERIKLIEYPNLNHFVTTNMMEECIIYLSKHL